MTAGPPWLDAGTDPAGPDLDRPELDGPDLDGPELDAARDRLRHRQATVLADLLDGRVPAGFDPRTATATGDTLRGKRRGEAVRAVPLLAGVPGLAAAFDAWARGRPRDGCAGADGRAFLAHLDATGALPRGIRDRLRAAEVRDGRRRVAVVRTGGRPELLVGVGPRVVHLSVRSRRAGSPGRQEEER